ncbi:MAG: phosphate ABC transporter permease PstA [Clostridiaceae bacterium]|nr:phosphate ABC transporter permease PstA [Clostridiaceae bacterium]
MDMSPTTMNMPAKQALKRRLKRRKRLDLVMRALSFFAAVFSLVVLAIVLYRVVVQSIGWLNIKFLTGTLSMFPEKAGISGVILGSLLLMVIVIPVTLILGVATAVYLEEYSRRSVLRSVVQTAIANLAGVPSVIFGLLGLTVFSRFLGLGSSILAGGLTLSLLVLPLVVVSSSEAIKAVPLFLRDASYALGATKWTTTWRVVLPTAMPGILTGNILALSRAIGETAPLVVLGIPALILRSPRSLLDDFTALPVQIYYWTLDTVLTPEYAHLAAATILVLLVMMFVLNGSAIVIRRKFARRY